MRRPHHVKPSRESARVILAYKNFAAQKNISHIGLGVAAMNTQRTLLAAGVWADVWPVTSGSDLRSRLAAAQAHAMRDRQHPISHVVISAPWIPTPELQSILAQFPDVHFAVTSHSNIGFLQADPSGIKMLRDCAGLTVGHHNFTLAGNCRRFCEAWTGAYGRPTAYLPNLYDVTTMRHVGQRPPWGGGVLRIGVYGATRVLKNMVTAASAAVILAEQLRADLELHMNSGRNEGPRTTSDAVDQIVAGLKNARLVQDGWQAWPDFRRVVSGMHLLLNVSYTESFNMVCADGCAEGVASVVGEAIDWAPSDWHANADDAAGIARVGRRLLMDPHAVDEGQCALRKYVEAGLPAWLRHLGVS